MVYVKRFHSFTSGTYQAHAQLLLCRPTPIGKLTNVKFWTH